MQERRLPILQFHRITDKTIFLTFWLHNFTIFRRCLGNIFETNICHIFLEYSGNIASWLLKFAKKPTFVITKPYTFNTKTTFPSRTFWKTFSFKMFPKCSLDVSNIATLREHSANIPGILRAGWVLTFLLVYHCLVSLTRFSLFHHHPWILRVIYLSLVIW